MSSYLYGSLTRRRVATPSGSRLGFGAAADAPDKSTAPKGDTDTVRHWQDAVAALVPAEVLSLHAVAMSYGTTTTGSGSDSVTRITYPREMIAVYVGMLLLSAGLYVAGAKRLKYWEDWLRMLVPPGAFVAWTMIQPSTAFDAFPFGLNTFARTMIAIFLAIILGALSNYLATRADQAQVQ